MRRIVVSEFISLEGVMEDPGGAKKSKYGGWAFQFNRGPEGDKFKNDELFASDALLLGRVTYQEFSAAWPSRKGEFADKMNGMTKFVVSTTLDQAVWNNSKLIKSNVVEELSKLKAMEGKDILVAGSGKLVNTLMAHDLVDEYRLMVFPIFLGGGERLFKDGFAKTPLQLVESKAIGSGVITLINRTENSDVIQQAAAGANLVANRLHQPCVSRMMEDAKGKQEGAGKTLPSSHSLLNDL